MKIIKFIIIPIALVVSLSSNATTFIAGNNSVDTKICIAVAENDLAQYKKRVKRYIFFLSESKNHRLIANKLKCNGQNIAVFSYSIGANTTGDYISHYLKNGVIKDRIIAKSSSRNKASQSMDRRAIVVTAN